MIIRENYGFSAEKRDKRDCALYYYYYELKEDASATCLVRNKTSPLSPHRKCRGRAVLNFYNFLQVPRKKLMHNIMQYSGGATTTTTD